MLVGPKLVASGAFFPPALAALGTQQRGNSTSAAQPATLTRPQKSTTGKKDPMYVYDQGVIAKARLTRLSDTVQRI